MAYRVTLSKRQDTGETVGLQTLTITSYTSAMRHVKRWVKMGSCCVAFLENSLSHESRVFEQGPMGRISTNSCSFDW